MEKVEGKEGRFKLREVCQEGKNGRLEGELMLRVLGGLV